MLKLTFLLLLIIAIGAALDNSQAGNVFDDADRLFQLYKSTVETVTIKARTTLEETGTQIENVGQAITSIAHRIIDNSQANSLSAISELDRKASQHGLDSMACTYYASRYLVLYIMSYKYPLAVCINQTIDDCHQILGDAFANLDNLELSVADYSRRIENCRSAGDEICAMLAIAQMELQNDLLPVIVDSDVQEVVNQFGHMELYFQECSRGPVDDWVTTGRELVATATQCIEDMISQQESAGS